MSTVTKQRMSAADAAWLHMDRRTNRMIVNSVMWFDEELDEAALRTLLQERLVDRFPRFSQRVVDRTTSVWWEPDEDFQLDRHLHHAVLPEPGGPAQLQRWVGALTGRPLDRNRPLWEMHLVHGYRGTGCALVARLHHCIADGVALARVMLSLTDDPHDAAGARVGPPSEAGGPSAAARLGRLAGSVVGELRHPSRLAEQAHDAAAAGRSLARLLALAPDAHTSLRGRLGGTKSVVWTEPVSLERLHRAARSRGATVNDIVLAALAGAIRFHLAREDGTAPDVRAVVPVNLRPLDEPLPAELGNEFGLLFVSLPTSVDDPLERLAELRRRTEKVKTSADPLVSFELLDLSGHLPYEGEQAFVTLFTAKASAVITNVIGPDRPVYLAGRRMRGTIAWPPESGGIGLGMSIMSYDGDLLLGAMTDDALFRDPVRLLHEALVELDELVQLCEQRA